MFDFTLFQRLPPEVRDTIYTYILTSPHPIRPHLCDTSPPNTPRFHDDNATHHDSTSVLTNLTRASKTLRSESLPVFYAANTFEAGNDTTTYFAWLQQQARFSWIRKVNLSLPRRSHDYAAWVLWLASGFDTRVCLLTPHEGVGDTDSAVALRRHPRYLAGGLSDLNTWILLRMLSTCSEDLASGFESQIVLPVSDVRVFETDAGLQWVWSVARGLGMDLRFVQKAGSTALQGRRAHVQWNRKYQGESEEGVAVSGVVGGVEKRGGEVVMERARELFPGVEGMARPRMSCYFREPCGEGGIVWFDAVTMGGGMGMGM